MNEKPVITGIEIKPLTSFTEFLSKKSNNANIFLEDCTTDEIIDVIGHSCK